MTLLKNSSLLKQTSLLRHTGIPVNLTLPVISGTAQSGQTLSTTNGTWSGLPTSYTYQWYAGASQILGATANTLLLTDAQIGAVITVQVIAYNPGTSNPATSAGTSAVIPAAALTNILAEGDSITVAFNAQRWNSITAASSPDSYSRLWTFERTFTTYVNTAVGGSTLGNPGDVLPTNSLWARQAGDIATAGLQAMSVLIGANDLDTTNPSDYLTRLLAYVATFRAIGVKVAVCTILTRTGVTGWDAARATFNTGLRAQVGTGIDAVVDFDTTPCGVNGNASNTTYFLDGLHPTQLGNELMKTVFATAMDGMCSITSGTIMAPYLARRGTAPSSGFRTNLTNFLIGLMTDNVYNEIQCLRNYADENATDALLNFISASNTATLVNSPTFTASKGYKGNGTNAAINTNIAPNAIYQDTISFGNYVNAGTDAAAGVVSIGVYGTSVNHISYIIPRDASGLYQGTANNLTFGTTYGASATIKGLSSIERSASNLTTFYRNGTSTGTDATASDTAGAIPFFEMGFNVDGGGAVGNASDFQIAVSFVGRAMGATKQAALSARILTFLTAIGAN